MGFEDESAFEKFELSSFLERNNLHIIDGQKNIPDLTVKEEILLLVPNETDREIFAKGVDISKRFLSMKSIQDTFDTDHKSRRNWREKMWKKYGNPFINFYQNDRMRVNVLGPLLRSIYGCLKVAKRMPSSDLKERLLGLNESLDINEYETLSSDHQKRDFILRVETLVKEFLSVVATARL
jgi:hypothetical protein